MKNPKKVKDGSLYFRQKDILRPVGAVCILVGLVWFYFGMSAASYYIPSIITPLGLVLFIVGGSKNISDNDIAEQLAHAMQDYDKVVTDRDDYSRTVLHQPAPVESTAYSFGDRATYFKRGKNSTPISDRYVGTHIFFTKEALLVAARTVSIAELGTAPDAGVADLCEVYHFSSIASARLDEHTTTVKLTNSGKALSVKWYELVLQGTDGELLRLPVKNDMDMANLCEDINRRCGSLTI